MPRIEKYMVTRMIDVDGEKVLHVLLAQRRAGVLTLHLGAGRVATLEWKENGRGELQTANHVPVLQEAVLD